MTAPRLSIVFAGLSITSSWGNGHATTYRALVRGLSLRGHDVLFLERDVPWYARNRDLPRPPYGRTELYSEVEELTDRFEAAVREADLVVVGSYVPDGVTVGEWVVRTTRGIPAFYDIDTPVTLAGLATGNEKYLSRALVPRYRLYLSFTGGPTLARIEKEFGSPCARALYCSVDPTLYFPEDRSTRWDLGYLGTYSDDRQPALETLMLEAARRWPEGRFAVAGSCYPAGVAWPAGIERIEHLPPSEHRAFYNAQRFTLNVTRAEMVRSGYSPSVRLFEAAACGVPIVSDRWPGLDTLFEPRKEILLVSSTQEVLRYLRAMPESERTAVARRSRARVLADHTAERRAEQLEAYALELLEARAPKTRRLRLQAAAVHPAPVFARDR